jgi:glycosyltransferase involved in cell wall biosynthesis
MREGKSRRRPSVMFVLGLAPQKIGGVEKFLRSFSISMNERGWDTILCFDGNISDEFRRYVQFPFVQIESLNNQGHLGMACSKDLWRLIRRYRPHTFLYAFRGVMRFFPWLARLGGCRLIYFNDHSSRELDFPTGPLSISKRLIGRILTYPLDGILSVAEFTKATGTSLGISSAPNFVVPNGVEIRDLDAERRRQTRERFSLPQDKTVVTQVSAMLAVKGVDTMLHAAKRLLDEGTDAYFMFCGDGPLLDQYRGMADELGITKRVRFTGLINNPTDEGIFDASDLYCQPSLWQEACPLAVLEAMSLKLAVVASRIGGLPELLEDGKMGLLAPAGDANAVGDCLLQLIRDEGLRRTMGEAGYRSVVERHQLDQQVEQYVQFVVEGLPWTRLEELTPQLSRVSHDG